MILSFTLIVIVAFSLSSGILLWLQYRKIKAESLLEKEKASFTSDANHPLQLVYESTPIGTGLLSLEGRWMKANMALCQILGYTENQLLQSHFKDIIYPDDYAEDLNFVNKLNSGVLSHYQIEERFIRYDKKITWILLTRSIVRNESGLPLYYIIHAQDVNDKRKTENELSYKAYYDTLTGLFNRNQLEHSLDSSISSAIRNQKTFAVFFIDLDHFKKINDRLGHDTGDHLLKMIGDRLKTNIRQTDIAARLGGDEFILVLNGINNAETAAIFAEKIINILIQPIKIKEHELFITSSIGISFYPSDGSDFTSLIKSADLALYKAKEKGRNNYQFCTPEMNHEIKEKIHFKNALQGALKNHEFHLVYFPKLNLRSGNITGFEALLRWKNDRYGNVSPNKIIPLAEEMGIMSRLSEWILQTAIDSAKLWQQYGSEQQTKISLNISARQYFEDHFVYNLLNTLQSARLTPDYLQVEVNEDLIMRDPDYSLKIIRELKKQGINIIIDNFGTGYSSLSYLHQFEVDYIKIDRHFTSCIQNDDKRVLFLVAMVDLARNLNIRTLAEGVETQEQKELLTHIGCDEIQGFLISPPIPGEEVPNFLEKHTKALSSEKPNPLP